MARSTGPTATQLARVLHAALIVTPALFAAGVVFVVRARPAPALGTTAIQFALVAVVALTAGAGVLLGVRHRRRATDEPLEAYYRASLPRMILVWAMLESSALLASITGLLTGGVTVPVVGLLGFLVLITAFSPRRLAGD